MNDQFNYIGEQINGFPHGSGTLVTDLSIFTGFWEKGLRIKTGIFDCFSFTIKVKFKQGKIYKLLETTLIEYPNSIFRLPQLNYVKEGEFFRELSSKTFYFAHKADGIFLFDRLFTPSISLELIRIDDFTIFYSSDKTFNIKEIRKRNFRFISKFLNFIPHGRAKLYLNNDIQIKGYFVKFFFLGPCKISQGSFQLLFNASNLIIPETFTVKSDELGINVEGSQKNHCFLINELKGFGEYFEIIKSFILDVFDQYLRFTQEYFFKIFGNHSVSYSLLPKQNWLSFEKDFFQGIRNFDSSSELNQKNKSKAEESPKICENFKRTERIKYDDGSFYYGEVKKGLKDGLGSLIFSDSTKFHGYFKNDKIWGLGNFYAQSYKIKGIWSDNRLEKVINYYEYK